MPKRKIGYVWFHVLIFLMITISAAAQGMQDCHRVVLTKQDVVQENGSVIRCWSAATALAAVDNELNALTYGYVDQLGSTLQTAGNKTTKNSRMDVVIRYSRTGMSWLSFLVQARVTYHRSLIHQEVQSLTYNMITGQRITLTDLFAEDSPAWSIVSNAVQEQISAYFPDDAHDAQALAGLTQQEELQSMAFTLHGMSLVLHIPAHKIVPQRHTLMEVTLMYPAIRPYMTAIAQKETDNLTLYKTCALTFDDGPSRTNTSLVLNALTKHGARATFFILGKRIDGNEDVVRREHDEGHSIGAHNWHHGDIRKSSATALRQMVSTFDHALTNAIGIKSRYNRVPYGLYPQMSKAQTGWPLIQWSLDTYDWRGRYSTAVLNSVTKQLSDGDIILCHDIADYAPKSTEMIIAYLKSEGYMLLTIDELFAKDGVALQGDNVYYRCLNGDTDRKKQ